MWKRGNNEAEGRYFSIFSPSQAYKAKRNEVDANHNLRLNFVNANSEAIEEIWILLTRHLRSTQRTQDFICLRVDIENPDLPPSTRIDQQRELSNTGTYTNSSHFLVRTRIPLSDRSGVVAVTASYEGEKEAKEIGFSVSVFSSGNVKVAWDESVNPPPYSTRVRTLILEPLHQRLANGMMQTAGTLTSQNSGGNCSYPTFMNNPQYHLRIHPSTKPSGGTSKKSATKIVLRALKDVPVNVVAIWSKGDRKDECVLLSRRSM
jgi:calpain-7